MYEKIWKSHIVRESSGDIPLIYVDRHLIHEVTSPQAFEGLRLSKRNIRCLQKTIAVMDHNVPTRTRNMEGVSETSQRQIEALKKNCVEFGVKLYDLTHPDQGVIHIIGPEQGLTLPGMVIVCGDSHTATHGAFGALAFGIGTSEVEHVLATQTLQQYKSKTMLINIEGEIPKGVTAKDIILYIIGQIGTDGATGYVIEYAGETIEQLNMEERMTICNMSIEAGARSGMMAPDNTTFQYLNGKDYSPKGEDFDKAVDYWSSLKSGPEAIFDKTINIKAEHISPQVTWGTSPGQVTSVENIIPNPKDYEDLVKQKAAEKALSYMDLQPGTKITDIKIDNVFIGSCTNGRISDLRAAAKIIEGKKVHENVEAIVVPGSGRVKCQAEEEGLDKIFIESGFEWRYAGCSMCLAMNDDVLGDGKRCASTSNRNFEGRQGPGGRTHLVSPEMAAAAAINGHFVDIRDVV